MTPEDPKDQSIFNPKFIERESARVEIFSDAVFAIVITLLVLDIKIPDNFEVDPYHSMLTLTSTFAAYFLSFLTIGVYWVAHHNMFNFIKKSNTRMMWYNLIFLIFIALIPFPTKLVSEFNGNHAAALIYGILLVLVNISLHIFWSYVTTNPRLVSEHLPDEAVEWIKWQIRIALLLAIIGIIFSSFFPHVSYIIYGLIVFRFNISGNVKRMIKRMQDINRSFRLS